jgi:SagB-type dehydrogenase family enzyme
MKMPEQRPASVAPRSLRSGRAAGAPSLKVALPEVVLAGEATLRRTLETRRSTREYSEAPLQLQQVASLLWAAQGITSPGGLRTAPSAGAIYPLRGYFLSFRVEGLPAGFYGFAVDTRALTMLTRGDKQAHLVKACSDQQCVQECAAALLLTAWYGRVRREFGALAEKLVAIEAGHIGQNWHLQAAALGLGSISLGNFDATAVKMLLPIPQDEEPVYLLLAGQV